MLKKKAKHVCKIYVNIRCLEVKANKKVMCVGFIWKCTYEKVKGTNISKAWLSLIWYLDIFLNLSIQIQV